jgi:hypothetical protein
MVALWCVIGLAFSAVAVSTLGAGFSVFGLSQLFSGAAMAVVAMAAALEFAKFVLAAYLHQTWSRQNQVFKYYLSAAVVVLSVITSMGIFGFLSNAYQSASAVLETENIRLSSLNGDLARVQQEVARINKAIDEIPANRVTKKLAARAEAEEDFKKLNQKTETIQAAITEANLRIVDVKQKVGPLIYIARAFHIDIDQAVKYLILVLVLVFDPLAICLVIATSQALKWRANPMSAAAQASPVVKMRFVESENKRPAS